MFAFLSSEVKDPIQWIFIHNMDDAMGPLGISKLTLNMWVAAILLAFMLWKTSKSEGAPKGILRGVVEMIYFFVRDGIVYPVMGETNGRTFLPFFLTMFSFILMMNLLGLVPIPEIGGAATGTLGSAISLASIVFLVSILAGIKYNGVGGFIKGFLPAGVPGFVIPLLFPIEIIGFVIKHAVLAIRLFANMLAGHLVLGGFLGLIFMFESYAVIPVSIPLALFMNFLELLVSFLQAYVFTLLSVLFIGGAVHPDH